VPDSPASPRRSESPASSSKSPLTISVAFVLPGLGVVSRGAEAFVGDLARALLEREAAAPGSGPRFEVTVFCRSTPDLRDHIHHRLQVHRVHALPRDTRWLNRLYRATRLGRKALDTLFLDPLSVEWATAALSALPGLLRGRYDVVVMEGGLVGAWVARGVRRRRGSSFVDIAHGLDPKWEGAFARRGPDRTVVFTRAAAEMLRELAPDARIEVIPHGVDLTRFRPEVTPAEIELPRPVVLAVGAVDAHKRLHLTVEALARLRDDGTETSLLVLGDGSATEALDRLAAARLAPGRYRRATVSRDTLPGFYAAADVFTLPSVSESFGLVYLEAMACGTPVVAPDDAVRREVVGEGGLLTDVLDPVAYGRSLSEALGRGWGTSPGNLPRRWAERFSSEATAQAYAQLFQQLATSRATG
jgi:glycosyltransferase involved in cell wall biosynthesis